MSITPDEERDIASCPGRAGLGWLMEGATNTVMDRGNREKKREFPARGRVATNEES